MIYDPQTPIAVFLGPSLERSYAQQILVANYYPPAQLGDIYRLLGSGVRIIVLIDGVFHSQAAIWQREILEALDNNIIVLGASSMGALRASELHPFGMIGHGTVFEWYRDGIIEGDDEVALLYADVAHSFWSLSEPLVNIRHNLQEAVSLKLLSEQQYTDLIAVAKATYYGNRSYQLLFDSSVCKSWSQQTQAALIHFLQERNTNLKRQDAISVLKFCHNLQSIGNYSNASELPIRHRGDYYSLVRSSHRGFLNPAGYLVTGKTLLTKVMKSKEQVESLRSELVKWYYFQLWLKQQAIAVPLDYSKQYQQQWETRYVHGNMEQWLRSNGLTKREFQTAVAERAAVAWAIAQATAIWGVTFNLYIHLAEVLLAYAWKYGIIAVATEQECTKAAQWGALRKQLTEIYFVFEWATDNGITCPDGVKTQFLGKWEEHWQINDRATWLIDNNLDEQAYFDLLTKWACSDWLIAKAPTYFGYATWSFEMSLLQELQITGQAAQIIKMLDRHEFEKE